MRVEGDPILSESYACHTEDRCLPKPTQRRDVDAARGIAHVVGQVDLAGLLHIASRERPITQPRGDKRVERRAQRAAVRCSGLVVVEVGLMDSPRPFVP